MEPVSAASLLPGLPGLSVLHQVGQDGKAAVTVWRDKPAHRTGVRNSAVDPLPECDGGGRNLLYQNLWEISELCCGVRCVGPGGRGRGSAQPPAPPHAPPPRPGSRPDTLQYNITVQ